MPSGFGALKGILNANYEEAMIRIHLWAYSKSGA